MTAIGSPVSARLKASLNVERSLTFSRSSVLPATCDGQRGGHKGESDQEQQGFIQRRPERARWCLCCSRNRITQPRGEKHCQDGSCCRDAEARTKAASHVQDSTGDTEAMGGCAAHDYAVVGWREQPKTNAKQSEQHQRDRQAGASYKRQSS